MQRRNERFQSCIGSSLCGFGQNNDHTVLPVWAWRILPSIQIETEGRVDGLYLLYFAFLLFALWGNRVTSGIFRRLVRLTKLGWKITGALLLCNPGFDPIFTRSHVFFLKTNLQINLLNSLFYRIYHTKI